MDAVAQHTRGEASLDRAVGDPDRRLGRVEACCPCIYASVQGIDWLLVEGEGDDFIDLPNTLGQLANCSLSETNVTHDDLHIGIRLPHEIDHRRVRPDNGIRRLPLEGIVGTKHELDHIGLGRLQPASKVVIGNVHARPAGMAFVTGVKVRWALAVLRQTVHGADEVNLGREACGCELVPDEGPPAGDLGDGIAKGH